MTDVVVAGGGPAGLATAALLDAAGVRVEVFERDAGPSEHSKAIAMHPRSLEVLSTLEMPDGRRVSDALLDRGKPVRHAHFAALPQLLDFSGLETPYPFVLMIPQARTERVLADHLRARGVPVHYGRAVEGFDRVDGGVRVRLADGSRECRYLVGADGARSSVRGQAGIGFEGSPPTMIGFVADVVLDDPPAGARHWWHPESGAASIVPLPDGVYRIFGGEPGDTGLTSEQVRQRQAEPLTLDGLRAKLHRILGTDRGLREAHWLSKTGDSTRSATHYRSGRVLLAGDAAHVHLPAGGQGLNVGLQDAANLGWKLAAEIRGWAPRRLVDGASSYEHERRHVGELLAENTLAQGALMYTFTPSGAALRAVFAGLIERGGDTADELIGWLSGIGLSYPQPPGAHPLVGTRAPNLDCDGTDLLRALRPDRFLLVDLSGRGAFGHLGSDRVEVRAARPGGAWAELSAVLVRPDGYVAEVAEPQAGDLATAVADWAGAHAPLEGPR